MTGLERSRPKVRTRAQFRELAQQVGMDPLMTQVEVAMVFGVTRHTVYRWVRGGALNPFSTPGGHKRFRTSEVLALAGVDYTPPGSGPPPAA